MKSYRECRRSLYPEINFDDLWYLFAWTVTYNNQLVARLFLRNGKRAAAAFADSRERRSSATSSGAGSESNSSVLTPNSFLGLFQRSLNPQCIRLTTQPFVVVTTGPSGKS